MFREEIGFCFRQRICTVLLGGKTRPNEKTPASYQNPPEILQKHPAILGAGVLSQDGTVSFLDKDALELGYRTSRIQKEKLIVNLPRIIISALADINDKTTVFITSSGPAGACR